MKIVSFAFILMFLSGVSLAQREITATEDYEFIPISTELDNPTYMTHAGDERLFIVERPGRIRIIKDGALLETPFLDITDLVKAEHIEQGLLSVAFAPDYAQSGVFYIYYTAQKNGDNTVARYRVSDDPDVADPESREILLAVADPYPNHNGGLVVFGPDGYLYIGMGDGGSGGDPEGSGQRRDDLLASILRIDVSAEVGYRIPEDNPFVDTAGVFPEIWVYGLRNPWRFSFDSATGDLYIGDVGESTYEEINFLSAGSAGGQNYGWNLYEADTPYKEGQTDAELTFPIHVYPHEGGDCAITGGYVYHGEALPELQGKYLYGDWCTGAIRTLERQGEEWITTEIMNTPFFITSFGMDIHGEIYVMSYGSKMGLYKFVERQSE